MVLSLGACTSFKAERVSVAEGDKRASEITDTWLVTDTEIAVKDILRQIEEHKGYQRYLSGLGRTPKLFIAEVKNNTAEPYFPIDDLNDELLNEFSASGDFILIDAAAREHILKEITFQNDGMVTPSQVKQIGKMSGADIMIFGNVYMQPATRDGKTIKEYTVNIRMTDIEQGVEVLRVRVKNSKYSKKSSAGW